MSSSYRVAVQGFSAFERSALSSYLRLVNDRTPGYELTDSLEDSQFVVADADHNGTIEAVVRAGRVHETVFVGSHAPDGATAWMMRPINPLYVLRELDAMVTSQAPRRMPTLVPSAVPLQRNTLWPSASLSRRASDSGLGGLGGPVLAPGAPARSAVASRQALLADESEMSLHFLELRLRRLGWRTERAGCTATALAMLDKNAYDFMFIDIDLGLGTELTGLQLCQRLKQRQRGGGTVVVMTSERGGQINRVRSALAGGDDYLSKPFQDEALQQLLQLHNAIPAAASRR